MSKHKFRSRDQGATLRSVLIGVGGVLGVTAAVAVLGPKVLHRPPAPPTPTVVQGQVAAVPSPVAQDTPAPPAEEAAAPDAPAAPSSQGFASASPSEGNPVGQAVQAPPSGEAADLPQPAPQAHPIHHPARRPVKKPAVAHHVRPAAPVAGAGPQEPGLTLPPPPPVIPGGVVVGGRKPPGELLSRQVSLADLDLSTSLGACKALGRIRRTAEILCPYEDEQGLNFLRERKMCVDDSVERAVQDLHVRKVEALNNKGPEGC